MKLLMKAASVGMAAGLFLSGQRVNAELEIGASISIQATAEFEAPLAAHGTWVDVGGYGRCFRPSIAAVEWRPYCEGHWVWTDCGWYWDSDEPWSWACYHYGSWYEAPTYGWVWVPAIEWAPAWVEWRFGGGYCGWAPRAPHGIVVTSPHFVFVETRHFHERIRPTTVIVNNTRIIQQTTVIAGPARETRAVREGGGTQRVVVNRGPDVNIVQRESGRRFSAVPIREESRKAAPPPTFQRRDGNVDGSRERRTAPFSPERSATQRAPERTVPTQPPQVDERVRERVTPTHPEPPPDRRAIEPRQAVPPPTVNPAPTPTPVHPTPVPRREPPQRDFNQPHPAPPGRIVPPQPAPPPGPQPGVDQPAPHREVPQRHPAPPSSRQGKHWDER